MPLRYAAVAVVAVSAAAIASIAGRAHVHESFGPFGPASPFWCLLTVHSLGAECQFSAVVAAAAVAVDAVRVLAVSQTDCQT